jgi:ketose-bisphosphate aldolase
MPLEAIGPMMRRAASGGYAVGYFESWNLESLQGVVDAAEQTASPIILGFNGAFLSGERAAAERLALYAAVGRAAAESSSVPCGLIFNECPRDGWVQTAIGSGFNLVMLADPAAPYTDYVARVAEIVRLAHARGVAVEGELGELPNGAASDGGLPEGGSTTDPAAAAEFVAATGIDLLAVSVGNVHIQTRGESGLDLRLLERIHQRVPVPLVLHGGTGVSAESLKAALTLGVAKVNFGTYLKQRYLKAVRAAVIHDHTDPHRLLGMGGPEDVLVAGRLAVRDAVLERIERLGCCGKAEVGGATDGNHDAYARSGDG